MKSSKLLLGLIIALYLLSLFLPAIVYQEGVHKGFEVLAEGWIAAIYGNMFIFAWYANALAFLALIGIRSKTYTASLWLSGIAILLALQSFYFTERPLDEGGVNIWHVDHLGVGFYVWFISLVLTFLFCLDRYKEAKNLNTNPSNLNTFSQK